MLTPTQNTTTPPAPYGWRCASEHNNGFPAVPGCYAIYLDGELAYIGQSGNISSRLSSYRIHIDLFGDKTWACSFGNYDAIRVKWKPSRRYGEWLMREARLIRRLRPRFNIVGTGQNAARFRSSSWVG